MLDEKEKVKTQSNKVLVYSTSLIMLLGLPTKSSLKVRIFWISRMVVIDQGVETTHLSKSGRFAVKVQLSEFTTFS